jgi:protein gp37
MTIKDTGIQWTDSTWNPVTGCTKVSAGCKNCYAEGVANRFWGDRKFTDVQMHEDRLIHPVRWTKPRRIFVNSMSDLFHDAVTDKFIDRVFASMALAPQHQFQVLTKRPERMLEYMAPGSLVKRRGFVTQAAFEMQRDRGGEHDARQWMEPAWPLPNVWLGVSVEDQRSADERIPILLQTPAAIRFLSCEPLLGPVDLSRSSAVFNRRDAIRAAMNGAAQLNREQAESAIVHPVDWVIVGGESGPRARHCDVSWIRSIVEQCKRSGVPCFTKQLGSNVRWNGIQGGYGAGPSNLWPHHAKLSDPHEGVGYRVQLRDRKGGDMQEWPDDLRVREFPKEQFEAGE